MERTADVIIIGAGVMGCAAAFELSRRGLDVVVLEREAVGAGGTGRSSAIIRQHYSNRLTARMALYSLRVFQAFEERVGGACGFRATGWVGVVAAGDRAALEANVRLQQDEGIRTSIVGPEHLLELMPGVATSDVAVAAYEPDSGYADPHLTVNSYAAAARRHGAAMHPGVGVTGIRFAGDRVAGVVTGDGDVDGPAVVNCAGPWAGRVAAMADLEVPVRSSRVQVAVFRRPVGYRADHPVVMDFANGVYLRPETGGLTLVGSIETAEGDAVVDPDDYPEHADSEFVERVGERFLRRFPPMEDAVPTTGYASLYGVTPDWHPIVDEVPPGSGHYLCVGFSGHGFKLAPAVGAMVADLITDVEDPAFAARPFRLARFEEVDGLSGRYSHAISG